MRLEVLILKYRQMVWGYKSAIVRDKDGRKLASYRSIISKCEGSMERIKEALEYLEAHPIGEFNFHQLCSRFGFRGYKQEKR